MALGKKRLVHQTELQVRMHSQMCQSVKTQTYLLFTILAAA